MAMNFMGLGFSFGAKDSGLSGVLKDVLTRVDGLAEGIRTFGTSAEKATQPMANLANSFGGKVFEGAAEGLEHVGNALEGSVFEGVLKGSKMMEDAERSYNAAGEGIGMSFDNVKNSLKGVYQQLVGDRIQKFAEQIPVERFKAVGEQIKTSMGMAGNFAQRLFGMKKGFEQVGQGAEKAAQPLQHFASKDAAAKAQGMDQAVKTLSGTLGQKLPAAARKGGEKFKRSADGIEAGGNQVSRSFQKIDESASKMGKSVGTSGDKFKSFLDKMPMKRLAGVAGALGNIGSAGGELTTGFEAAAQQNSVDTRKIVANTGLMGKELNKANQEAAGLVMGMKVSAQTAGHATSAMIKFGPVLKAIGVDSAATGVKLEDGLGIPIYETAQNFDRMQKGLKLTDKDLGNLSRSFMATGEAVGDVQGPIKHMDEIMSLAQRRTNLLAQGVKTIGGKDAVMSINQASRSLYALTGNAKGAQEAALTIEGKLVESLESVRNMFTGTESELHGFLTNTSVVTGDVTKAFKSAEGGVGPFIDNMSDLFAKLKKGGKSTAQIMKMFGGRMTQVFGDQASEVLLSALDKADEAKVATIKASKAMSRSFGEAGKETWRSSMTLKESMDLIVGAAEARFRNLGRGNAQKFVTDASKQFAKFNDSAEKISKEGGPLGKMVDKMSEISFLGAKAFLPEALRPMSMVFSKLGPEVATAVQAFGPLVPALLALLNPVTLILAAFTLLHLGFKQTEAHIKGLSGKDTQAAQKSVAGLEKQLKGLTEGTEEYSLVSAKLTGAQANLARVQKDVKLSASFSDSSKAVVGLRAELAKLPKTSAKYAESLEKLKSAEAKQHDAEKAIAAESRKEFVQTIKEKLKGFGEQAKAFVKKLPGYAKELAEEFATIFTEIDWRGLWKSIGDSIKNIDWKAIGEQLKELWTSLGDAAKKVKWGEIIGKVGDQLIAQRNTLIEAVVDLLDQVLVGSKNLIDWDKFGEILKTGLGVAVAKAGAGFSALIEILRTKLLPVIAKVFDRAVDIVKDLPSRVGAALSGLGPMVGGALKHIVPVVLDFLVGLLALAGTLLMKFYHALPSILEGLGDLIKGALDFVRDVIIGIMQGVRDWLVKTFPSLAGPITAVFDTIESAYRGMYDGIKFIIDLVIGVVTGFERAALAVWDSVFGGDALSGAASAFDPVIDVLKTVWNVLSAVGEVIFGVLIPYWNVLWSVAKFAATVIWSGLRIVFAALETIGYVIYRVVVIAFKVLAGIATVAIGAIVAVLTWLWKEVWEPQWNAMAAIVVAVWEKYIKPVWDPVAAFFVNIFDQAGKAVTSAADVIVGAWATVRKGFKDFFDWIEKIVDDLFGHSTIPDAFDRGFKAITTIFSTFWEMAKGIFDKVTAFVGAMFAPVTKIVDKIFGGGGDSVASMIGAGMDKALDVIKNVVGGVVALVQKTLYDAIVEGITSAFVAAFKATTESSKTFFKVQLEAFTSFTNKVFDLFKNMWFKILTTTLESSVAMTGELSKSLNQLGQVKAALDAVIAARTEANKSGTKEGEQLKAETDVTKYNQQMLDQARHPDWFMNIYGPNFDSKMGELIGAVKAIKAVPMAATGTGGISKAIDKLRPSTGAAVAAGAQLPSK